mmetsp:Transcript_63266/g.120693  ORF Transcript_63266/g.120693 Transcript_63266/m.120693 type:complete len:791 (+) Transcript_63266:78-2450(+)
MCVAKISAVLLCLWAFAETDAANPLYPSPCLPPHDTYPFCNTSLPMQVRVADLHKRLTLHEKVGMLFMDANMAYGNDTMSNTSKNGGLASTAVPRLGLPQFNWMGQGNVYRGASNGCNLNCCSCYDGHNMSNCCTDGAATQFPQGTGIAATFNKELIFSMGVAIGDESLALNNHFPNKNVEYRTGASSVINIARDPRWGRVPETYGEDPLLTAEIALSLNKALMGYASRNATTPKYGADRWKVLPVIRHFVGYAGPDAGRFNFDAVINEDDLNYTYLYAWKRLVEGHAIGGVMSAISALNGVPSACNREMLTNVLRNQWGYDSYVTTDCDTITAISDNFHYVSTVEEAVAVALRSGGDLNCGPEYSLLENSTLAGFDKEQDIDRAVQRLLYARGRTGALDPVSEDPYASIPLSVVDSPPHRLLARRVIAESVVLLKNEGQTLPLQMSKLRRLAVIGPSADDPSVQAHTYHGTPSAWITVASALRDAAKATGTDVKVIAGCDRHSQDESGIPAAISAAQESDAVIFVGGIDQSNEEEDVDRPDLKLGGKQLKLISALFNSTKHDVPIVVLLISGSPLSEPSFMSQSFERGAVVWVSYFGQDGNGVVDVLLGQEAPSGRLPFTVPLDVSQLPAITDYAMNSGHGRTHRYLDVKAAPPLFPFAWGMSYANITASISLEPPVVNFGQNFTATIQLQSDKPTLHVVALFAACTGGGLGNAPKQSLVAFEKVQLSPGASSQVKFALNAGDQLLLGLEKQPLPGAVRFWVGDASCRASYCSKAHLDVKVPEQMTSWI